MHENKIIMLENAMHEHVITNQQSLTQKFQQKHKNPNCPKKFKKPRSKCMKDEEKKRFGPLTNKLKLGIGRKSEGMTDFGEERVL